MSGTGTSASLTGGLATQSFENEAGVAGDGSGLTARLGMELVEDRGYVMVDSLGGNEEGAGYLAIRSTLVDQPQHIDLPPRQGPGVGTCARPWSVGSNPYASPPE